MKENNDIMEGNHNNVVGSPDSQHYPTKKPPLSRRSFLFLVATGVSSGITNLFGGCAPAGGNDHAETNEQRLAEILKDKNSREEEKGIETHDGSFYEATDGSEDFEVPERDYNTNDVVFKLSDIKLGRNCEVSFDQHSCPHGGEGKYSQSGTIMLKFDDGTTVLINTNCLGAEHTSFVVKTNQTQMDHLKTLGDSLLQAEGLSQESVTVFFDKHFDNKLSPQEASKFTSQIVQSITDSLPAEPSPTELAGGPRD